MTEKPLFVALKTEHFEAFKGGLKERELRKYGPRWNEDTCRIGRAVTLSKGYGNYERITREVTAFEKMALMDLNAKDRKAFISCYGPGECFVAVISCPAL